MFQFTRPQGARRAHSTPPHWSPSFNSRARKGRDSTGAEAVAAWVFQFTRPQGARLSRLFLLEVSIHAPARGATGSTFLIKDLTAVSIHAPARGATITNLIAKANNCVSIHAPARGATQGVRPRARLPDVSIHAPARGATAAVLDSFSHVWFQFTRPQGARPRASSAARRRTCFNSRARKGRDVVFGGTANNKQGFQFTRPQGARRSVVCG